MAAVETLRIVGFRQLEPFRFTWTSQSLRPS